VPNNESLSRVDRNLPYRTDGYNIPTLELAATSSDVHFSLLTFWAVVMRRMSTILAVTFIATALAAIYSFKATPVYRATSNVEVEAQAPPVQTVNELYSQPVGSNGAFLGTQGQVLRSDDLAWQTIEQLGLSPLGGAASREGSQATAVRSARVQKSLAIAAFKGNLSVEQLKESSILAVSYESGDPELAARAVNQLVDNYTQSNFQERFDFTRRASGGMEEQLEELRAKVEKSQEALIDYERQNLIVNTGDKGTINDQRVMELNADLTHAESERVQKQSVYDLVRANPEQVGIIVQNDVLARLEEKYNDQKSAYADAASQYGPNYPKVVRMRDQLNILESLMQKARTEAMEKVRNDYLAAVAHENLLKDTLVKEKAELSAVNQRMIEHNILQRNFEINQQLYANLLQRLKDATLSASLQATNVHVIDRATPPLSPIRPHKVRNVIAGLVLGLALGITIVFLQEALVSSVRTTEEAEKLAEAPALAVIPSAYSGLGRRALYGAGYGSGNGNGDRPPASGATEGLALAVLHRPSSPVAESFRSLRTSVLLSTAPRPPQVILVTSSQANEGKTTTASNLAMSFAQRGGAVLLVDADLRRPSLAKTLGLSGEKGLSSYLTGAHTLDEVLVPCELYPNLWVLPAGPRPPDPAELFSSPLMEATISELRKRFTHIVLDSPPVLLVTDPVVLSAMVDGAILVVGSGATPRGGLVRARRVLETAGARLLGIVMNKVDMRFDSYYGSYYYGGRYYSYYGEPSQTATPASPRNGGTGAKRPETEA